MSKPKSSERTDRGGLNSGDLDASAKRAAQHMSGKAVRGRTWGVAEQNAIARRDNEEAAPSGAFVVRKPGAS